MVQIKKNYGPQAILDQAYAGTSYGVLHKSDQIEGLLLVRTTAVGTESTLARMMDLVAEAQLMCTMREVS